MVVYGCLEQQGISHLVLLPQYLHSQEVFLALFCSSRISSELLSSEGQATVCHVTVKLGLEALVAQ